MLKLAVSADEKVGLAGRKPVKITGDAAMLGFETQQVMHLRMMKIFAGGPKAQSEVLRMVTEKGTALAEATMSLARGGSAQGVIRRYRTHVKTNRRRLSKPCL